MSILEVQKALKEFKTSLDNRIDNVRDALEKDEKRLKDMKTTEAMLDERLQKGFSENNVIKDVRRTRRDLMRECEEHIKARKLILETLSPICDHKIYLNLKQNLEQWATISLGSLSESLTQVETNLIGVRLSLSSLFDNNNEAKKMIVGLNIVLDAIATYKLEQTSAGAANTTQVNELNQKMKVLKRDLDDDEARFLRGDDKDAKQTTVVSDSTPTSRGDDKEERSPLNSRGVFAVVREAPVAASNSVFTPDANPSSASNIILR